ncbi:MAG: nuoK [Gammaproteobacteria bacterium]|jgi:NADH-quinone oxidoreductase subunit K|nr:nuoK [Gammaproteobacteria bacterium]
MISLSAFLWISSLLFAIGIAGMIINRHNLVVLLMCIELLLLSVNTNFVAFSHYLNNIDGKIFVFFILAVAAAETAVGLAILMVLYRQRGTIEIDKMDVLNG